MPRYSDEIIDEVRQTNDIVDIISQYMHLKRLMIIKTYKRKSKIEVSNREN